MGTALGGLALRVAIRSYCYNYYFVVMGVLIFSVCSKIEEVLGKERAQMFIMHYYVKAEGNCDLSRMSDPHGEFGGKNVLIRRPGVDVAAKFGKKPEEVAQYLGQCRAELHAYRAKRPRPHLDDKVIFTSQTHFLF